MVCLPEHGADRREDFGQAGVQQRLAAEDLHVVAGGGPCAARSRAIRAGAANWGGEPDRQHG
ncbi:hypothetical protein ACFZB9_19760 [Kitasatospora sp. NPDC008050]|uniref:hypothetical protein n=1 Tax=Kitasatospora sp. NPDC008050 TaxID=3364021 RepID=UPI0036ECE1A7